LARTLEAGRDGPSPRLADQFAAAVRHLQAGQLTEAERLCREIRSIDPSHPASFHLGGVVAHQLGRAEAVDLLEQAVALAPDTAAAHHDLGVVLGARGRLAEAVSCFERATALKSDYAEAYDSLGTALAGLRRFQEAHACFGQALAINPRLPMVHVHCANALRAQGELDEAVVHYERAIAIDQTCAIAHYNLAATLKELRRTDEAVDHYRRALELVPHSAEGHNNLGLALHQLGRLDEALAHCHKAIALRPDFAGAHNNLANALRELGRLDEAMLHYDRTIALAPDNAAAHYNRGILHRRHSRFDAAISDFERALTIKRDFVAARFALCMAQLPILYQDEADLLRRRAAYEKRLIELSDATERKESLGDLADVVGAHQPFYLAYQGFNDRELQAIYGAMTCRIMTDHLGAAVLPPPPAANEPVRVGIVSGFFRHHSNWKIPIKGWLSQLDRGKFELFGYYTGITRDRETDAAETLCGRFVCGPLPVDDWRRAILDDAPHVLIYPELGMDPMAVRLAAQRLAPVQCASWGHPDTSGLPTIDSYLSSDLMEPPDAQNHYTERLIRLPNLSIYYEPSDLEPAAWERGEFAMRDGATVYWCGQAMSKYLPQYDRVLPRIAQRVGDCQFAFIEFPEAPHITQLFAQRLDQAFAAFGLKATDHCVFLPRLETKKFIASMGLSDIMLDSLGWSGCNSSLESLVHDLPIVTMAGALMRGRHTAAILTMMDVRETVAGSIDDYVSIAIRLARDEPWRAAIKAKMAENKHRVYRDRACIAGLEEFLEHAARGCRQPG
jgi:predicted O-linked N-acetylglucosamine transferase (SPINDLY family)